jgi:lipoprotein-anchoring transpeptidase ErfK/SrfK
VLIESPPQAEVKVQRFEWVAATDGLALLRLAVSLTDQPRLPVHSRLVVYEGGDRREFDRVQEVQLEDGTWSFAFSGPREVVEWRNKRFVLMLAGVPAIPLPLPTERRLRPAPAPRRRAFADRAIGIATGTLAGVGLGLVAWVGVVVVRGGNPVGTQASSRSAVQRAASAAPTRSRPHRSALAVPAGDSIVAQVRARRINVYPSVRARVPKMVLSNPTAIGGPLVFLVASANAHRLKVLLPVRPNLSEGWVSRSDVQLAFDPYRIEVQLRQHRMTVWRGKSVAERDPVGVGRRAVTPTPFGLYYITELLKQPDPTGIYGPYAFGLSAYSDVLHEFAGGNGEVGIHGTNEPWFVGTDVSHGCIRVYNSVITRLARELPLGTPVRIAP